MIRFIIGCACLGLVMGEVLSEMFFETSFLRRIARRQTMSLADTLIGALLWSGVLLFAAFAILTALSAR